MAVHAISFGLLFTLLFCSCEADKRNKTHKQWLPLPYSTFSQPPYEDFVQTTGHFTKTDDRNTKIGDVGNYSDQSHVTMDSNDVIKMCVCGESDEEDEDDEAEEEARLPDDALPEEQKLMIQLLRHYERAVRPVKNASDTVVVKMGMTLTQIFDLDEKNEVLVTNVWLDQEWDDMFLTWDPEDYGGLEVLRLPCHKLWLPDIVLYNNAAEYTDGLYPANAMITSKGNVFWPVPTKLFSACKVDVTYFPFDDQKCVLKFGSWTYDGYQVDMTNRTIDIDLSNYIANGEWELLSIIIERNVVFYACCDEPFPDVTFTVHIRRRTIYYLYNVIFPCVMMSTLTLLVFCLPPDSGEKVTMGITVLLAFSVFLLRMGEDLPETSEFIPLLSIYLTIVMAMTSVSVIMTVFVLNLHHRGPSTNHVPRWLKKLFLSHIKVSHGISLRKKSLYIENCAQGDRTFFTKSHLTIENLADEITKELEQQKSPISDLSPSDQDTYSSASVSSSPNHTQTHNCSADSTSFHILKALQKIVYRHEQEDNDDKRIYEWRQLAVVVDKILFWIFLAGTLSSTIIVLIVAPITRWL